MREKIYLLKYKFKDNGKLKSNIDLKLELLFQSSIKKQHLSRYKTCLGYCKRVHGGYLVIHVVLKECHWVA